MRSRDEFRAALITFGERALKIRDHLRNEEATRVSLVLPFIALLGYDDRDPTEVAAEHASDFSEKYRNRVDYAVLRDMKPIIGIECKSIGNNKKDDRGQLKAYFNAAKTIKLGILTDGILYEFFVDSNEPNLMDDDPFLIIDFAEIAKGQISETALDGLHSFSKGRFDPDTVADHARRSLTYRAFFDYLSGQYAEPSLDFTRFLLKENDIKHVRSAQLDMYRAIVRSAFNDVFAHDVLRKLNISPVSSPASVKVDQEVVAEVPAERTPNGVVTTAAELTAFEAICRRLAFSCAGDAVLFDKIQHVQYRDYQGKMVVFYSKERKGRIVDILEGRDGQIRYALVDGSEAPPTDDLVALTPRLFEVFKARTLELDRS